MYCRILTLLNIFYFAKLTAFEMNYAKIIKNETLSEYMIKTRHVKTCDFIKTSKKYTAQYVSSIAYNKEEEVIGYVYVPRDQKIMNGMLSPGIWKDGGYKTIFNKTSQSPCADPLLSIPLFMTYHADLQCNIKKGNYSLQGLHPNRLGHLALGNKFIPCRLQVLLKYSSRNSIFYCLEIIADVIPITKMNVTKVA